MSLVPLSSDLNADLLVCLKDLNIPSCSLDSDFLWIWEFFPGLLEMCIVPICHDKHT